MTVDEFNKTIAREKIIAPADASVRILQYLDGEIKIEVLGKTTWVTQRKTPYLETKKHVPWDEFVSSGRPSYTMCQTDINLGPSTYMVLQWIRSLSSPNFSISYAAQQLHMTPRTIRKCLQILAKAGKFEQRKVQ